MKKKPRRLSSHPLLTPEKKKQLQEAAKQEDAYLTSPSGKKQVAEMTADTQRKLHGGARAGAGRKPVDDPKVTLSLRVSSQVKLFLQSRDNASDTTEETIRRSAAFREWAKSQSEK